MRSTMQKAVLLMTFQILWISGTSSRQNRPGRPRIPFQYRLPSSAYSKSAVNEPDSNSRSSGGRVGVNFDSDTPRTLIASASLINPMGFDFTKLTLPVKRSRSYNAPVIPLLWVDLPHQDKPIFEDIVSPEPESLRNVDTKYMGHGERDKTNFAGTIAGSKALYKNENKIPEEYRKTSTAILSEQRSKVNGNSIQRNQNEERNILSLGEPFVAESKDQAIQSPKESHSPNSQERSNTDPSPNYNFSYSVSDPETRDVKSHSENRLGDVVRGEYSVLEPDGYTRVVTYIADAGGFKATVKRIPPSTP